MEALLVLGYRQDEAEAALMAANPGPEDDAENVIRQSLQWLAKKRDAR
jgi:Holliday junction resolvasome RuvABC DNA-binding subunit